MANRGVWGCHSDRGCPSSLHVAASSHIDEDDGERKALLAEFLCPFLPHFVTQAILGLGAARRSQLNSSF